jgi:Dockerin type I domain
MRSQAMSYVRRVLIGICVFGSTVSGVASAAQLNFVGTQFDVGGKNFPNYNFLPRPPDGPGQCCFVPWRTDSSGNIYSARSTPTGRYYGVDGWALFGTMFEFPNANTTNYNIDYRLVDDPQLPNLEQVPYFVSQTQILAHHKGGADYAALIDDPRTQWGGRWWTFDGVNYPPPNSSNGTGSIPYLKTGYLHGWDEYGHNPLDVPAGRYAFVVGENAPKRFRVGVMTDGLATTSKVPEQVYLAQMDPTDIYFNSVLDQVSSGVIPVASGATDRFIDMHFFDIVDAQPGDLFVVAAGGNAYSAVNGISFDVLKDPGDYNGDGVVNAADYTFWRNSLGEDVKAGERADGNLNSQIDAGDYDVWKQNFGHVTPGSGSGSGSSAVPEPASFVFVVAAALSALVARSNRRT